MRNQTHTSVKNKHWKHLNGKQRLRYIWDYYKLLITIFLIILYILSYTLYGRLTKKEVLLYIGLVNMSAGEQLTDGLSHGFIDFTDTDAARSELRLYTGLYLTDDPDDPNYEYAYASRIKIMASIDGEKLDAIITDKKTFDAFSQDGDFCDMEELLKNLSPQTREALKPYLVTGSRPTGLCVSQKGLFNKAGFSDDVYLGVFKNSPRKDRIAEYIEYLYSEQ